jgi:phospholipase/carboxylesterase
MPVAQMRLFRKKASPAMPMALSGPSRPPFAGGKPTRLVILLHGLGADGNDLIGLQQYWGRLVPEAEFVSPNAPFPCDMAPYGYQWFSVQDRRPPSVLAGVRAAAPSIDAYIDDELAKRGLDASDAALVGFSQGTMMALFVGLRRAKPLAGILGYSGRLIAADLLPGELRSRPPVLLVHGTEDPLVPFESLAAAEAALNGAGVPVETLACVGIEHAIDPEGLARGGRFLREVLSAPQT